jgi:hypothetical protein
MDSVWRRGWATRRSALYAGAGGLAIGAAFGATASSLCPDRDRKTPCARGIATSAVAGLLIGGLAGAALGSGTPRWQLLHPRGHAERVVPSSGQEIALEAPGDPNVPDPRTLALARVRPGALVRLEFADQPDLAGFVIRAGARRALLAPVRGTAAQPAGPVSLGSLEAVWERGTAQRTVGVLGLLLGFGVAAAATIVTCEPGDACAGMLLFNAVAGGMGGGALGAGVGSLIPRWHRRF